MCGIVGAISERNVVPILLEGLKRLEYRGYDSAGIAVVNGSLTRLRSIGRVAELANRADERGLNGKVGIAHTRWATHGVPSERNAHPHVSGPISVVHNGIIENHEEVRRRLQSEGYEFTSDTDSEVIAHLVHSHVTQGAALLAAVHASVKELIGAYALVQVTSRVVYLEEGDCAEAELGRVHVIDTAGKDVERPVHVSNLSSADVELGPYRHYMLKEIFEQPMAVANTLELVVNAKGISPQLF